MSLNAIESVLKKKNRQAIKYVYTQKKKEYTKVHKTHTTGTKWPSHKREHKKQLSPTIRS